MLRGGFWWSWAIPAAPGELYLSPALSLHSPHQHLPGEKRGFRHLCHLPACSIYMTNIGEALFPPKGGACCQEMENAKQKPRIPLIQTAMTALKKTQRYTGKNWGFWIGAERRASRTGICKGRIKVTLGESMGKPPNSFLAGPASPGRNTGQEQPIPANLGGNWRRKFCGSWDISFLQETGPGSLNLVTSETELRKSHSKRAAFNVWLKGKWSYRWGTVNS